MTVDIITNANIFSTLLWWRGDTQTYLYYYVATTDEEMNWRKFCVWLWHVCYDGQTTNKNWMIGISFSRDIFSYFVVFSHLTTAPRHTAKIMKYEIADQIYVCVCMTLMMTICCINIKIFSHRHFVIKIKLDDVNSYNEKIAVSYWYSYQVYSI